MKRWYFEHDATDHPKYSEDGIAYFGPFFFWEVTKLLNDGFAETMAQCGDLEALKLSRKEAKAIGYINPRRFWMRERRKLSPLTLFSRKSHALI